MQVVHFVHVIPNLFKSSKETLIVRTLDAPVAFEVIVGVLNPRCLKVQTILAISVPTTSVKRRKRLYLFYNKYLLKQ